MQRETASRLAHAEAFVGALIELHGIEVVTSALAVHVAQHSVGRNTSENHSSDAGQHELLHLVGATRAFVEAVDHLRCAYPPGKAIAGGGNVRLVN